MLTSDLIPDKEPILRVGIILPEDKKQSVTVEVPLTPAYQLIACDTGRAGSYSGRLLFERGDDNLVKTKYGKSTCWRLKPLAAVPNRSRSGLKVFDIAAGRGFHWQKPIDVYFSGLIEIKIYKQHIILINEIPLEAYLMCVATSEMGAACPPALIESQTITARSWMLANREQKHQALGMDVCNDDCCQRYQGNGNLTTHSILGATNTFGQILLYEGKICDARYSKSCGGMMESFASVWDGEDLPYIQSVPDAPPDFSDSALPLSREENIQQWIDEVPRTFCSPHWVKESDLKRYLGSVDESGSYFRWHFSFTQEEITTLLKNKLVLPVASVIGLKPISRGGSGRLTKLEIIYLSLQGEKKSYLVEREYRIRQVLHPDFLYSSCFYIKTYPKFSSIPERFDLSGAGWGHGAGYCQIGALGMALAHYSTKEILAHYYPGSQLQKIY